jgi:hypothetical protein
MKQRPRMDLRGAALFGAAGWLFADLLLALAMVFLVANSHGKPIPIPTPAPPTPTPTPTVPPTPVVLDPNSVAFSMRLDPGLLRAGDLSTKQTVLSAVLSHLGGKHAGLVLTFGGQGNGGAGYGTQTATLVNQALQEAAASTDQLKNTAYHAYVDLSSDTNTVSFEIYVFK